MKKAFIATSTLLVIFAGAKASENDRYNRLYKCKGKIKRFEGEHRKLLGEFAGNGCRELLGKGEPSL